MLRAVLFDLDGTLLDSASDLVAALNRVRETEGLFPVPVDAYRHHVSRGAPGLIGAGLPPSDEATYERRRQAFYRHYAANSMHRTVLFNGVPQLLEGLASRAIPWGIVTNKIEALTLPILGAMGLSLRAGCVVCGDTLRWAKPHPAPVRLACELLGVDPWQTLMVGDDPRDIEAGRSAGTQTAYAAYGYVSPGFDTRGSGANHVLEQPLDVLALVSPGFRVAVDGCVA